MQSPSIHVAETAGRGTAAGDRLMRLATYAAVAVACLLILAKFVAYLLTGSVSMLSTLIDSLLDAAASLVNLVAVNHALMPADREHRFGHGKAEALAGLGQSTFIAGSAVFLLVQAGDRLYHPHPIENSALGIGVMLFSMALTAVLVVFQRYVIRRTRSVAITADSLHYAGDVAVNIAVLVAFLLSAQLGWHLADPIFALAIGLYIVFVAWQIARSAYDMLMDRELPDAERERIKQIARAHPKVRDLHDLRTRMSGRNSFIQFHLEMDGQMTLAEAHELADEVEADILAEFPGAEVIIHEDPEGVAETRVRFG
jgi:ferrous-iron efflux pump FieF